MRKRALIFLTAVLLTTTALRAQVSLTALGSTYAQDFNMLASSGSTNDTTTLPGGWKFTETGTNANATYAASTGSSNTGNTYSLGTDSDRAFGGLQSGSLIPTIGVKFVNNTGATITSLHVRYTGEQWRLGASSRTQGDRLDFQYSLNASSLVNGTWINDDSLDFSSPVLSGTVGAMNGNLPGNFRVREDVISGLFIPAGATFWFRWNDFNVASSDDALGIDDFSVIPQGAVSNLPMITTSVSALDFGQILVNSSKTLSYSIRLSSLRDSVVRVNTFTNAFSLSLDQVNFNDSLVLTHDDTVYVRFTPHTNGNNRDSIYHANADVTKSIRLTGFGYDPLNNIISISEARSKSTGVTVTVAGRITVGDEQGSPSFIQDGTGGIAVFDNRFSQSVSIGDSVIVTGKIDFFNSQVEITNASFSLADSAKRYIQPKHITIGELTENEGLLVTVDNVSLVNKAFVFYPQSTEKITDGTTLADLRIDGDTNIPGYTKPQGNVNVTGIVGRFKTNVQLLPRFRDDIPGTAAPQTPFDSIPKANTFDLMNWNLEFFGAIDKNYPQGYGPANETLQLQNARSVIDSVHADVIAVQEVSNDSIFRELVRRLPGYKAVCSDRYSYSFNGFDPTFPPQKVCFIYDSGTVHPTATRVMFETLYDSARLHNSSLLPNYPTGDASSFWSSGRLPFMMTAEVTIQNVTERIRFIDIHAKSGDQQSDYDRRVYDVKVLKDSLDAHYPNDRVVILGDYNDDLRQSIVTGLVTSYEAFVQDTARYTPITLALSEAGAKSTVSFNGVIDNQIISNELNDDRLPGSQQVITPFLQIPNYGTTTSDHLPVVSRFSFQEPTISIITPSISKPEANDSIQVVVALSKAADVTTTITLGITNGTGALYGSDYTTDPLAQGDTIMLTIPANHVSAAFWVRIKDDTKDEQDEVITFRLLAAPGATIEQSNAAFTLTILDNDNATIQFAASSASREEGSGAYAVTLRLSSTQSTNTTALVYVSNGPDVIYGSLFDYTTTPSPTGGKISITIPAGQDSASFTITPNKDLFHENNELVKFEIGSVTNGVTIGTQPTFNFTIVNAPICLPVYTVFPNPTFGVVNIYTLPENENTVVSGSLIDPQGHTLLSATGTPAQLGNQFTTALEGKRIGVYILRLSACGTTIAIRILKI